jgi:hypothetical protein
MGGLFSYFRGLLGSREMRILILGLDGAGEGTVYTVWNGISVTPYKLVTVFDSIVADPLQCGSRFPTFFKCGSGSSFTFQCG